MKPIKGKTVFNHWSDYVETPERYISRIVFDPLEEDNFSYPDCPPYMIAHVGMSDEREYYLIPPAMAYYARTHVGYTQQGRRNNVEEGRQEIQKSLRKLIGAKAEEDDDNLSSCTSIRELCMQQKLGVKLYQEIYSM